ncbi:MAG: hypothetical protein UW68_C0006G0025 [Candidatus Collierbacteria bacterium GW2011_GWB1_44_6]|uniref:Uncharacterized protein n=2 Tax=Candidatus Collieribacteriota TaxID=1752725 RepID=A0A0G1JQC5_9BACT|nr:MAG: hypothetical protein UV68_C0023G0011 [Candidatus Collierbacteria bacterium GW2011_GWC2_43_12]KKT73583.1 MAG: hypothetical protein UW68_C0006G0025 [Candidatus Collierbacteria bacterium GW2011_GWB1_44_6]KKT83260.1 MAG: hypothetical protein UW80_C0018G0011 [Microgenomates group bacterium GW2011_GWC1_44_9]
MARKKKVTIVQIQHYQKDDAECEGDYYEIELQTPEGKTIATFGSYYDDKGMEKAEGFIKGVEYALGVTVEIIVRNIADR